MTAITDKADTVYRDMESPGSSVPHDPEKLGVRQLFGIIDAALASLGVNGAITVKKATLALLNADLAHVADTLAVVYNDGTASNNGIYAKVGGSGSGSWALTALALPSSFGADLAEVLAAAEAVPSALAAAQVAASDALDSATAAAVSAAASETSNDSAALKVIAAQAAEDGAEQARDEAIAAAALTGPFVFFTTKAEANAALAGLPNGQQVRVWADESQGGDQTGYEVVAGAYVLQVNFSIYATRSNDLSDLSDPAAARANLGADLSENILYADPGTGAQQTNVEAVLLGGAIWVDQFYQSGDGADYGLMFSRAYAAGLARSRNLVCSAGANYDVATNINILPNLAGWTPLLNLNGSTVTITAVAGGFRRRGLKDGAVANVSSGSIYGGTIDANNITGGNGVRCIFGSNSSGTFDDVAIVNMSQGYGWRRYCYADGGAVTGSKPVFTGTVSGIPDADDEDVRWFGCADDGDLSYVQPGSPIAPGQARPLATVNNTQDGTGCATLATVRYWSNGTGSPINVPAAMTAAAYVTAGLTSGATDVTINGVVMGAVKAEVYTSAQARFPRNVVRHGAIFRNAFVTGGYYGFFALGTDGTTFDNVGSYGPVRGVACEFGAVNVFGRKVLVTDSASSSVLINYGSTDADLSDVALYGGSAWDGQALLNIQLGAARASVSNLKTRTADNVTDGEYHVYVGPHCSGFRGRGFDLLGDCIKAWVCAESAWRTSPGQSENFTGDAEYAGLSSVALTDVEFSDVTLSVPAGTSGTATAIAFCQTNDATNGEIGLSNCRALNVTALSSKHLRYLVVREEATVAPTTNGATSLQISNIALNPLTAFSDLTDRMLLPRGRKHFSRIVAVTNIDDQIQRPIQNSATPSITYGNRFVLNGVSAITNLQDNGSGSTGRKCADGHFANFRGGGQTLNNNGGTNGIILKAATAVTMTTTQELSVRYDAANDLSLEVARGF